MNRFGFIVHPTSLDDLACYEPGAVGKGMPLIRKILEWMPPYLIAEITGVRSPDGREIEGWFSAVPLMPEQIMELPREEVYGRILKAIELVAEKGAQVVGLGAFTSIVGDGGVTIAERSPIPVTTGNSLTIATAIESLFRAAEAMGIVAADSTAVVLGATGSIGSACLRLLAPKVGHVILVAPNATRLAKFHASIEDQLGTTSEWTTDIEAALPRGDLILSATSATREVINPALLRIGAVVCEVSLPHTIGRQVVEQRPDVLVVEGGNRIMPGTPKWDRVRQPGRAFELNLPPGSALACMSEAMVLALEGRFESYTLGRGIALEKVREIGVMAQRCGFALAEMRVFERTISSEDIARKREAIARLRGARLELDMPLTGC